MKKALLIISLIILLTSIISCDNKGSTSDETELPIVHVDSFVENQNLLPPKDYINSKVNTDSLIRDLLYQVDSIAYLLREFNELDSKDNFLNSRIQYLNKRSKNEINQKINLINHSKIDKVFNAKIKGTQEISDKLYLRAEIEIWECESQNEAEKLSNEVEKLKVEAGWDKISKSPITYWQQDKCLVFITPGGFYMLSEVEKIEDYLRKELDKLK